MKIFHRKKKLKNKEAQNDQGNRTVLRKALYRILELMIYLLQEKVNWEIQVELIQKTTV